MVLTEYNKGFIAKEILEEGRRRAIEKGYTGVFVEIFAEGYAEGYEEGYAIGREQAVVSLTQEGLLDIKVAANRLNLSVEEFKERYMGAK